MAASLQSRSSQANKNRLPSTRKGPVSISEETSVFGRMANSSLRTNSEIESSTPCSTIKLTSSVPKRRSSTLSISHLIARRKSLQTTALTSRRQSLWMNIAKKSSTNDVQPSPLPIKQEQSKLIRKKFLRLLLVFSYLLSISLLAIALATFYGFFWSGYGTPQTTTTISDTKTTVRSLISLTLNSTLLDVDFVIEDVRREK